MGGRAHVGGAFWRGRVSRHLVDSMAIGDKDLIFLQSPPGL